MFSSVLLYLMINFLSVMIVFSCFSFLILWIGLEVNLISFVPLLYEKSNKRQSDSMLKYFLIQVFASSFVLFSSFGQWYYFDLVYYFVLISMSLKLALYPFYYWLVDVIEGLSWNCIILLSTWQKVIPLYVSSLFVKSIIFSSFSISSIFFGSLLGLNQTMMRKVMAYSSIVQMGWVCLVMVLSSFHSLVYFFLYCLLNLNVLFLFSLNKVYHFCSLFLYGKNDKLYLMSFFSLAGLPPFTGFLNKFSVLVVIFFFSPFMSFFLVMISLLSLFFYLRVCFSFFMMDKFTVKIINNFYSSKLLMIFTVLSSVFLFWFV